jgi:hypothetical protein
MKPILFNTEMVKAILDGRKTVTRRKIDRDIINHCDIETDGTLLSYQNNCGDFINPVDLCRYKTGDILYVRETWCKNGDTYLYKAGNPHLQNNIHIKWKPSIHMPKEAARIFLSVKDVRVERLQDITEEEAEKEGAKAYGSNNCSGTSARIAFAEIWDGTTKPEYEWRNNPWVWVIEFERISEVVNR